MSGASSLCLSVPGVKTLVPLPVLSGRQVAGVPSIVRKQTFTYKYGMSLSRVKMAMRQCQILDAAATLFFGLIQSPASLWALHNYKGRLAKHHKQMWQIFK